jgi:hypothetical protein
MKYLAFLLSMLCVSPAIGAPSGFVERGRYGSGSATIEPAVGGEYVYGEQANDARRPARAVLIGTAERQLYVFFSDQEEQALLNYRDRQLAKQLRVRTASAHAHPHRATMSLHWPKVVVCGDQICVPELASSEAADWRDHLVCHREGGLQ